MQAARRSDEADEPGIRLPGLDGLTFDALLKLAQRRGGQTSAISYPGAATETLSPEQLGMRVARLAGLLGQIGPVPGQRLAILAPMGPEAIVTLLAALRLGLVPFLVPAGIDQPALTQLLERTGTEIVIGIDRAGPVEPLLMLREAAAHIFGMRCVAGFGSAIPDGVMPLDRYLASPDCPVVAGAPGGPPRQIGVINPDGDELQAGHLTETQVLEAGLRVVQALEISPEACIASTLLGGDLAALAAGLAAALLSGATFMPLGLFSLEAIEASLNVSRKVHLVAPAATATALFKAGLAHHPAIASLVLVHPAGQPAGNPALPGTIDVAVIDVFSPRAGTIDITVRRPATG